MNKFYKMINLISRVFIERKPLRGVIYNFIEGKLEKPYYTKDRLLKYGDRVKIGEFTYGEPEIIYWHEDTKVEIGKFCSISNDVKIILGGNHRYDWITTYPFPALPHYYPEASSIKGTPSTKGSVIIGNDVWIGYGATILSGVKIGDGAVIGARAVVVKNVSPYSIVVGNPGREIKKRFDDETINRLLQIKWWNWPLDKIQNNIDLLCSNSIALINKV